MPRLLKHPRCKDFFRASRNPMILESVTLTAKTNNLSSRNVIKILKSLKNRSFYKAIEIVSDIPNNAERNDILQILYAATIYTENNHYSNLLKLWIDDIYIRKIPNSNQFLMQELQSLKDDYNIIIKLGFEYKEPPIKKEPLW
jgi:hypothetical protein